MLPCLRSSGSPTSLTPESSCPALFPFHPYIQAPVTYPSCHHLYVVRSYLVCKPQAPISIIYTLSLHRYPLGTSKYKNHPHCFALASNLPFLCSPTPQLNASPRAILLFLTSTTKSCQPCLLHNPPNCPPHSIPHHYHGSGHSHVTPQHLAQPPRGPLGAQFCPHPPCPT